MFYFYLDFQILNTKVFYIFRSLLNPIGILVLISADQRLYELAVSVISLNWLIGFGLHVGLRPRKQFFSQQI